MEDDSKIYDRLVDYKDDPEAFNRETQRILEEAINEFPEERREKIRAYQWRLEQELSKIKDPVARYNKIVEMFYQQLNLFAAALQGNIQQPTEKADILEFKKPDT